MWKTVNMATDELINGFLKELSSLEASWYGIVGYDASECILSVVLAQTPDSVCLIYGNLFAIVKLGVDTYTLLNYSIWDGLSLFSQTSVIPESIDDYLRHVIKDNENHFAGGFQICEEIRNRINISSRSSDILDRVGKEALGLKGIVRRVSRNYTIWSIDQP